MARRSQLDIIFDMLRAAQDKGGEIIPTHMLYKANLSHKQLKRYVAKLEKQGFLEVVSVDDDSEVYRITHKGDVYVRKILEMREFEDTFDL